MVSCDFYCTNEMTVDAYSLLLKIFTFLEEQRCYELINLRFSFTHCKYSIVQKKNLSIHLN